MRPPTISISLAGRGQISCLKLSLDMTVVASGFFISEPSFANILVKDTPTEMVRPISFLMRSRRASAIFTPSPNSFTDGVTSSQPSSMPNGSTKSVY